MKKRMQNVLARNSNNEIAYLCGKCGWEVEKEAVVCFHCGSKLGDIKCPFCHFQGSIEDFAEDTCPRCGRVNPNQQKKKKQAAKSASSTQFSSKLFWVLFIFLSLIIIFLFTVFIKIYELF